jgi:lipoyl(octanoyl) transferase
MKTWRFIDTGEGDCYSNMAIDEALFQAYEPGRSMPIFRIYAWNPAAFSIGFSQDPVTEFDLKECERSGIDFVRRMTGGGVIFHDKELTYSIVCSEKDIEKTYFAKEMYKTLCSFLIKAYQNMGIDAEFSLMADKPPKAGWVCFRHKERYDIVIGGKKLGGNAQRRRRDMIFQHGSIPFQLSPEKYRRFLKNKTVLDENDACSLNKVMADNISFCELKENLLAAFKESLGADLIDDALNPVEKSLRDGFLQSKYSTKEWNFFKNADKTKALVA